MTSPLFTEQPDNYSLFAYDSQNIYKIYWSYEIEVSGGKKNELEFSMGNIHE